MSCIKTSFYNQFVKMNLKSVTKLVLGITLLAGCVSLKCKNLVPQLRYKYFQSRFEVEPSNRYKTNLLRTNIFHTFPKIFLYESRGQSSKDDVSVARHHILSSIEAINTNYSLFNLEASVDILPAVDYQENLTVLLNSMGASIPKAFKHFVLVYHSPTLPSRLLVTPTELQHASLTIAEQNITFGLFLPVDVCNENLDKLRALPLELVHSIIFSPSNPESIYFEDGLLHEAEVKSLLQNFEDCRVNIEDRLYETGTQLIFATNVVLNVYTDQLGNCTTSWFSNYVDHLWPANNITLFAYIKQIDEGPLLIDDIVDSSDTWGISNDLTWLKTRPVFKDEFIAYVISLDHMPIEKLPAMANSEIRSHNNILLEGFQFQDLYNDSSVVQVAKYFSRSQHYPDSRLWLKVNIDNISDPNQFHDLLVKTTEASVSINQNKKATIDNLVFELPTWFFHMIPLEISVMSETLEFAQGLGTVQTLPQIGLEISTLQCADARFWRKYTFWKHVDFVTISHSILTSSFITENPHSVTDSVMLELTTCAKFLNDIFKSYGINQLYYHVNIYGCYGNYTTIRSVSQYSTVLQGLHVWSSIQSKLTFISVGYEYDFPLKSEICDASGGKLCPCGWWIVSPDINSPDGYRIYHKKSVGWKLDNKNNSVFTLTIRWLCVAASLLFFIALLYQIVRKYNKNADYYIGRKEIMEFIKGSSASSSNEANAEGSSAAESLPYQSNLLEIPRSCFEIDESKLITISNFTKVYKTIVKMHGERINAVVKVAKERGTTNCRDHVISMRSLLSEIKILSYIGSHKRIVGLIGANTEQIHKGNLYVLLKYCDLGSLYDYLNSIKPFDGIVFEETCEIGGYIGAKPDMELNDDLARWALEIAEGMEYLASKKLVHADLATRNVLLTCEKSAKIADFGLTRRLNNYMTYTKTHNDPMPWRWMAPEALKRLTFNEKTDVWSFGVTLWEMYSLGDVPYSGLSWNVGFSDLLENNLRLAQPRYSVDGIYTVMLHCWDVKPSRRPTFQQLMEMLRK